MRGIKTMLEIWEKSMTDTVTTPGMSRCGRPAGPCRGRKATAPAAACGKLLQYCIAGTELNRDQISAYVNRSLMLVTALSPVIGYDKASAIAHKANDEGTTLRAAALATGYIDAAGFDRIVNPAAMAGTL
jgi:fumarate hydratase class II